MGLQDTDRPNTEAGNEWLNKVFKYYIETDLEELIDVGSAKEAILSYIQSNYVLKSDVEKILNRLEHDCKYNYSTFGNSERMLQVSGIRKFIEAERNRLKESNK